MNDLCDYEVDVLRLCAGEDVPGMHWGAAMGQALECLEGRGLVDRGRGAYFATQAGADFLKSREQPPFTKT